MGGLDRPKVEQKYNNGLNVLARARARRDAASGARGIGPRWKLSCWRRYPLIASKRIRLSWLTRDAPDRSATSPYGLLASPARTSPSTGFPARRIQCGLDVDRAAARSRTLTEFTCAWWRLGGPNVTKLSLYLAIDLERFCQRQVG